MDWDKALQNSGPSSGPQGTVTAFIYLSATLHVLGGVLAVASVFIARVPWGLACAWLIGLVFSGVVWNLLGQALLIHFKKYDLISSIRDDLEALREETREVKGLVGVSAEVLVQQIESKGQSRFK